MPVNYEPDSASASHVEDTQSIGKRAENRRERRKALQACIDNFWRQDDIGLVQRVETASKWGWVMHPYRAG